MTANDVIIAYTDGLVERRGEMLDVGMKRLQAAASRDSSSLDDMLSSIVTELSEDTPTDDIALIGLKWLNLDPGGPSSVTVKTRAEGGTPVVSLSGELDLTNVDRVRSSIGDLLTAGPSGSSLK